MSTKESMPTWVPLIALVCFLFAVTPHSFIPLLTFFAVIWIAFYLLTEPGGLEGVMQVIQNFLLPFEKAIDYLIESVVVAVRALLIHPIRGVVTGFSKTDITQVIYVSFSIMLYPIRGVVEVLSAVEKASLAIYEIFFV